MQTIILPYDALLRHLRQNQLVEERGIEPRTWPNLPSATPLGYIPPIKIHLKHSHAPVD